MRRKVSKIKRNPHGYAVRYDETRTAMLEVFPFMTHFVIDESKKTVVIVAVLHMSRNPDIWGNRG